MIKLAVLALLNLSGVLSKLDCKTPVVCDPSLESDIFLGASHFVDELACQTSCTIGHPSNPCKFFTFVPGAQVQVPNCYKMKQCNEMSKPIVGSVSGAWSCDDPEIFCDAIGDIPAFDSRKTTWTCDHNIHPYGDGTKKIFQDTACRTTCPSFESVDGHIVRADVVVSSTCVADVDQSVWGSAFPAGIQDTTGIVIESASDNPTPGCGCKDLVLTGIVQDENGKIFQCDAAPEVNAEGNTVITDTNTCFLECDGIQVFDIYCSMGQWSMLLESADEIFCHGGGGEPTDATGSVTLSTYWPPAQ